MDHELTRRSYLVKFVLVASTSGIPWGDSVTVFKGSCAVAGASTLPMSHGMKSGGFFSSRRAVSGGQPWMAQVGSGIHA